MTPTAKVDYKTGNVYVNFSLLWNKTKTETKFINQFSKILQHETLHLVLNDVYMSLGVSDKQRFSNHLLGEEVAIRMLCNQGFTNEELQQYALMEMHYEDYYNRKRSSKPRRNV